MRDRDRLIPGQVGLDRTARIDAGLVAVHILQVDLHPPQLVGEAPVQRPLDLGADAVGQGFAVLNVAVGANLKVHGDYLL